MFDSQEVKKDFPILLEHIQGKPLIYLDNAATAQKPQAVIDAIVDYYQHANANVHRGVHQLSERSTQLWEESRRAVAEFFGASDEELIITRNTTEALNTIAYGWGDRHVHAGDLLIATEMEHHSNLVPWQELAFRRQATLQLIPVDEHGRLDLEWLSEIIKKDPARIKLIALAHVSNTLGTRNPIEKIVTLLDSYSSTERPLLIVDGAQAAPHLPIHFDKMGVDCWAFSGHKMLGPMGIGGLFVRSELLRSNLFMPALFGGGMIQTVATTSATYAESAIDRFTAGTPDVASLVGLAAACQYLTTLQMSEVAAHDQQLVQYALQKLPENPRVHIIGPTSPRLRGASPTSSSPGGGFARVSPDRVGSVAFTYEGVHAHDVAQILDSEGIAARSGHHCTMPLHEKFGWAGTVRISFQVYNSETDIDAVCEALQKVDAIFGKGSYVAG